MSFIDVSNTDQAGKILVRGSNRPMGWWVLWKSKVKDLDGNDLVLEFTQSQTLRFKISDDDMLLVGGKVWGENLDAPVNINLNVELPASEYEEVTDNSGDIQLIDDPNIAGKHILIPAENSNYKFTKQVPVVSKSGFWFWNYVDDVYEPTIDENNQPIGNTNFLDYGLKITDLLNIKIGNATMDFISPDPMKWSKEYIAELSVDFLNATTGRVGVILYYYSNKINITPIL